MSSQNGTTTVFEDPNLRQPQAPSTSPYAGLHIQPNPMFIPSHALIPQPPVGLGSHEMPWLQPSAGTTTSWAPQPEQPPTQPLASPPTTGSWLSRRFPRRFGFAFKSQDTDTCWRCKDCHKKCIAGSERCHRCETSPGNSSIPCSYGPVCSTSEIPFLCLLPLQNPLSELGLQLSPEMKRAADFVDYIRGRFKDAYEVANADSEPQHTQYSMFTRVATTKVKNINSYEHFREIGVSFFELPYDRLIAKIAWEMEDVPETARLVGVESVADLVGLLEAASLCESQSGHYKKEKRVVYSSMLCLSHAMTAMRLSSQGLLSQDPHSRCADANECISPGLRSLSKYAIRYTEALDKAIFHKHRRKFNNWLLIFYSLCIHSHVRRALMVLEQRRRNHFIGMMASGGWQVPSPPLASAAYLQDAVFVFQEISMQRRGNLASQIRNSRAQPSVYLQQPQPRRTTRLSSSSTAHPPQTWEKWHQEGVVQYLGRIFDISRVLNTNVNNTNEMNQQQLLPTMHHQLRSEDARHQQETETGIVDVDADSDPESDSDVTINDSSMAVGGNTGEVDMPAELTFVNASVGNDTSFNSNFNEHMVPMETEDCPPFFPSHAPSPAPSNWSMTSFEPDSTAPSFLDSEWTASSFSPTASYAGSLAQSRQDDMDFGIFDLDSNGFSQDSFHFYPRGQSNLN